MSDAQIEQVLRASCTIAVVGLSNVPDKPIHEVAQFLLDEGISIVPVHPRAERVFEQPAYRRVAELPAELSVDTALLAVRPAVAAEVLDELGRLAHSGGPPPIRHAWLQPGSDTPEAVARARQAGLIVISGRCMMAELKRHLE